MGTDDQPDEDTTVRPARSRGRGAALAGVAHGLRGALAVVVGRAQFLSRYLRRTDDPDPARLLAGLTEIERAARRAEARLEPLEGERGETPRGPGDRPAGPSDPPGDEGRGAAGDR